MNNFYWVKGNVRGWIPAGCLGIWARVWGRNRWLFFRLTLLKNRISGQYRRRYRNISACHLNLISTRHLSLHLSCDLTFCFQLHLWTHQSGICMSALEELHCILYINIDIPIGSVYQVAGVLLFDSIWVKSVIEVVVVLSAANEAFESFLCALIIVGHVSSAAGTARNATSVLLYILELGIDGVDEAAHGRLVLVVETEGGRHIGIWELKRRGVVLDVRGIWFVLFLFFGIVDCLLIRLLLSGLLLWSWILLAVHGGLGMGGVFLMLLCFLCLSSFFDNSADWWHPPVWL